MVFKEGKMLSGELLSEMRKAMILLFITVGLIVAVAVKNAIGNPGSIFLHSEVIILLLSIVDLSNHWYSCRKLYKEVVHQEMYVEEVKDTGEFIATEVTDTYSCTAAGKGKRITGIRMVESIREY